jgi:hypothetical protein
MALGLPIIGEGLNALTNIAKMGIGIAQWRKGTKQLNNLLNNRPVAELSTGYANAYKTYQQLANSELPGYGIQRGLIGQEAANVGQQLERGAMGSNQYMSGVLASQNKELDALKQLGLASAQWRSQQRQNLAQEQNFMGQREDELWQYNVADPWNIRANMANEQRMAGAQNTFGGANDLTSGLMNFAGTSAYLKMLQGLQKQNVTPDVNTNYS